MKIEEIENVFPSIEAYKNIQRTFETSVKQSLKSQIRILLGINKITQGESFQKSIDAISQENWKVAWARLFDQRISNEVFRDWLIKIGLELYIISSNKKQREITFQLLNGIYVNILTNFVKGILGQYSQDKAYLYQKSREIANESIYKILSHLDGYNPYKSGLLTWMHTIAKNTALTPDKKVEENTINVLDRETDEQENEIDKSAFLKSQDETPDRIYEREEIGNIVLNLLFKEAGYPWQILCLAFMKMDYKPSEIVDTFSQKTLDEIFQILQKEFYASSFRSSEELDELFNPLKDELESPLKEILSNRDSRTRNALKDLLEEKCGHLKLDVFFSKNPNKNISDWNARSLIRLRKEITNRGLI